MNHFRTSRTKEAFLFKAAIILTSFTVICPVLGLPFLGFAKTQQLVLSILPDWHSIVHLLGCFHGTAS